MNSYQNKLSAIEIMENKDKDNQLDNEVKEVQPKRKLILQIVNVISFVICMLFNIFT